MTTANLNDRDEYQVNDTFTASDWDEHTIISFHDAGKGMLTTSIGDYGQTHCHSWQLESYASGETYYRLVNTAYYTLGDILHHHLVGPVACLRPERD